jgi:hypothetical protein
MRAYIMSEYDIPTIATELNTRALNHPIGQLQNIRRELKHRKCHLSTDIFRIGSKTVTPKWACHYGGRTELQFNIGFDPGVTMLRHGVAFSLETSRDFPSIEPLRPKVKLFNDYLQLYPNKFAALKVKMWHWQGPKQKSIRSADYNVGPIPEEQIKKETFFFLGKTQPIEQLDYELILNDCDELLPLYRYVESKGKIHPISLVTDEKFSFASGRSIEASATTYNLTKTNIDVTYRHKIIQDALCQRLCSKFGAENVKKEVKCSGMWIDVVLQQPDGYWFYEIKTFHSPRACIREAVGQLLEYAFWPGGKEALQLIVIGESPLDKDGAEYLRRLNDKYALPISYKNVDL